MWPTVFLFGGGEGSFSSFARNRVSCSENRGGTGMRLVCKCAANCRSRDGPHRCHSVPSCRRGSAGWRSPLVHDLSHSLPGKEGEDPYFLWSGRRWTHRADGRQRDGVEDGLRRHALAFFGIVCRSGPDRSRSAERIIVRPLAGVVSFVKRDRTGTGTGSAAGQGINGTFRPCFGIRPPFARRLRTAGLRRFCRSKDTCRLSRGMAHFSSSVRPSFPFASGTAPSGFCRRLFPSFRSVFHPDSVRTDSDGYSVTSMRPSR